MWRQNNMAPPIKRNGTQIASCLRFKDKHGESYFYNTDLFIPEPSPRNRKERREAKKKKRRKSNGRPRIII